MTRQVKDSQVSYSASVYKELDLRVKKALLELDRSTRENEEKSR